MRGACLRLTCRSAVSFQAMIHRSCYDADMDVSGYKQSGFGRDGGAEALDDWSTVKAVKLVVPRL